MGLKTLMQIPTGLPGAIGGGPQQMPNRIDGYKPLPNDYMISDLTQPGNPTGTVNTAVGPGHPDYQGGSLQQALPGGIARPPTRNIDMRDRTIPDTPGSIKPIGGIPQLPPGHSIPNFGPPTAPKSLTEGGGSFSQPDYSNQFSGFGDQLGGFGKQLTGFGDQLGGLGNQMTGYQDALGGFNEQVGGFGKQFENLNTRLDSMEKGIASLGEQFQPQQPSYNSPMQMNSYNPYNQSNQMFGGLASLGFGGGWF